jgi:UDP-N-acetylglucosamine--N-acetylmuramyl-(pentapeptide) pyrophosphoryl-undecaprenol N-acetylglucosamine transferase
LLICGKPSILIPYPHAAYNHQVANAQVLATRGAARIILDKDLNGVCLGETIWDLYDHPEQREKMAQKARALAKPEAARAIVDHYWQGNGRKTSTGMDS